MTIDHGKELREVYRRMRGRQLGLTTFGYAIFYFVRKNIPVALPLMEKQLGVGWLGQNYGWRAVFLVPAAIALASSVVIAIWLRDTPGSLGLPPVEVYRGGGESTALEAAVPAAEYRRLLRERVFSNRVVWLRRSPTSSSTR